ncbi:chemotaxis protein CheA [Phaeobacter sp. CAU 1743]|uniref:chemotaxis protein CheA n=1 Tax=Phaeobacter sp. CAU 1743 TaxID=3140367 RepID=UPI0023B6A6D1
MVQNNKVLTVSYGTFSCTLEGFEDSFGTMKAIAEYFRDLASDDRYFGAEPPQPDADMLARIAQREIARQVEARTSTEGIHLRAATAPQSAPAADAAVSDAPTEEAQVRDTQKTDVEDTVAPISEQSEPTENSAAEPSIEESPAPEASADEAAEEPAKATDTDEADGDAATLADEEQAQPPAPDADKIAAISAAAAAHDSEVAEAVEDEHSKPAKAAEDESAEAEIAEPKAPKRDAAAAESIAAKLRRIRAVVSQTPQEDFSEDEHAESILSEAASDISEALAEDAAAEEAKVDEDTSEDDEISRVLAQLGKGNAEAEDSVADQPVVEAAVEAEPAPETAPEQEPAQPEAQAEPEQAEPAAEPEQAEPETAEEPRRPMRARVIKVKRADLEQVVATGALTNLSDSAEYEPATASATPGVDSSLSDEDEADLMRELAEVEAELLAASQETEEDRQEEQKAQTATAGESTEAAAAAEDVARKRPAAPAADFPDSDVSRLMDAADAKLDAPETASSRETYGHLRAAVAAAEADRTAGGSTGSENSEDAYRQDLASVVKPRRPVPTGARSARERSNASRPAPLKLVAEQRIDPSPAAEDNASSTPQATRPVRPRRISVLKDEGSASDATAADFAAYAAERGAVELQDLLEAAAAYMSFVEGRDHFSRPQLMNKVRDAGAAEFNREDGLRSFGQLLREGKIERSENGRFAATEETGFRPAKRAVG